jgi:GT2 family glycosyltransferase
VVDNGSDWVRLEQIVAGYPGAELLPMPANVGFAAGNNRAVEYVHDCRWIALLNVDTLPDENWLKALMQAAVAHPECAFFGSQLVIANSAGLLDGTGDVYHCSGRAWRRDHGMPVGSAHRATEGTVAPCAAAAMYRHDAWLVAGGLDETFVCYLEDVDLGLRLQLAGCRYRHVPESIVEHIGSAVTRRHSAYYVYHGQRNLVWAYVKNMPGILFWKYLPQHLLLNSLAVAWFVIRGRGLSVLRAKWDALKGSIAPVRTQHLDDAAFPGNCLTAIFHGGFRFMQQNNGVYIVGIRLGGLLRSASQPVRHARSCAGWKQHSHQKK